MQVNTSEKIDSTFRNKVKQARDVFFCKNISEMRNRQKLNNWIEDALLYLIHIAGLNLINKNIFKYKEIFKEVSYLLNLLKICLMSCNQLADKNVVIENKENTHENDIGVYNQLVEMNDVEMYAPLEAMTVYPKKGTSLISFCHQMCNKKVQWDKGLP